MSTFCGVGADFWSLMKQVDKVEKMTMTNNILDLQNGSDIRGIAISTAELNANLTVPAVKQIAVGVLNWASSKLGKQASELTFGLGCDSRLSGPELKQAMIDMFTKAGAKVIDFQLATTPAMFMATQFAEFACDVTLMLTASHLPYYYNGIKLFTAKSGVEKSDIQEILTIASKSELVEGTAQQPVQIADLLTPYADFLVEKIKNGSQTNAEKPLAGWHIIVDAGNGAGGFFAEKVLKRLGADISGSQFLSPDGHFPNHIPNPDNKEAMASIKAAVLNHQADLGVIFDTDVDRSAVVTKSGALLNRNNLIAVLSRIILAEHPHTRIVTNSPTTNHLKDFIESLGGKQVRYISGYRNVINKAIALNEQGLDTQLAIETSGHAAFKENYFLDDGAYVIAKILMLLPKLKTANQTLDDLIATLKQPIETQEVRFKLETADYRQLGQQVISALADYLVEGWTIDPENEEGIRFTLTDPYGDGWFLLRMSLHEPLLVLQVENDLPNQIQPVLIEIQKFLNRYPQVNQEKLKEILTK